MDVTYEGAENNSEAELVEHVVRTLSADDGILRTERGNRLVVLYARGIAAIEVAPRGAII